MKLFIVIPSLAAGGAERVVLNIANNIDRSKFSKIKLILFEKAGIFLNDLSDDIEVIAIKRQYHKYGLQWLIVLQLARLIRIEKPDVIISFMWYPNLITIISKLLSKYKGRLILSERASLYLSFGFVGNLLRRFAMRYLYSFSDVLVVNSKGLADQIKTKYPFLSNKLQVIYNPVDIGRLKELSKEEVLHPWFKESVPIIVGVGRLGPEKGFDYLIRAINILVDSGEQCRLILIGKGKEESLLKAIASELKISDRVFFAGLQRNPYKYMSRASVFVLSSLSEGFPNVLLEAMALGVPPIATRCQTGPEEIIKHGENGLLVPVADENALAEAIRELLRNDELREKIALSAKKKAQEFDVKYIVKKYEDVLTGKIAI